MKLFHSYVAGLVRGTNRVEILDSAWSLAPGNAAPVSGDLAKVSACHERLRDDARAHQHFSHAVFIVDNSVRAFYEFPDLAAEEKERKDRQEANAAAVKEQQTHEALAARKAALASLVQSEETLAALGVQAPAEDIAETIAALSIEVPDTELVPVAQLNAANSEIEALRAQLAEAAKLAAPPASAAASPADAVRTSRRAASS